MIKVSSLSQSENIDVNESSPESKIIWEKFLKLLEDNLKPSEISTWFSVIKPIDYEDNTLTICVPSKDYYGIIEKRYNKHINSIINSGLLGENGRLVYKVSQFNIFDDQPEEEPAPPRRDFFNPPQPVQTTIKEEEPEEIVSNLYPKNTFENFVRSESNELAVAAAWAITNNPGKIYNYTGILRSKAL